LLVSYLVTFWGPVKGYPVGSVGTMEKKQKFRNILARGAMFKPEGGAGGRHIVQRHKEVVKTTGEVLYTAKSKSEYG